MAYSTITQLLILTGILVLTLLRIWIVRVRPVQRDVKESHLPFSKRLHASDFFRKPRSQEIRDAFHVLPYGTLWYAINLPLMYIAGFEGRRWTYLTAVIDTVFIWLSFTLGVLVGLLYAAMSTFMLVKSPWNVTILWLTISAVFSWIFLLLAPAAKLPVGIPVRLGRRIKGLIFHQHNYIYYTLLGLMWLLVLWRTLLPWLLPGTWLDQAVSFQP